MTFYQLWQEAIYVFKTEKLPKLKRYSKKVSTKKNCLVYLKFYRVIYPHYKAVYLYYRIINIKSNKYNLINQHIMNIMKI